MRHYRFRNYLYRNCENYPTHELGPIANVLDINRGNRMLTLVSVASKAAGLHEYLLREKGPDYDAANMNFAQGDVVTTIIKCARGETICLTLDTTLPRAYSRGFHVQGTKGMYMEDMLPNAKAPALQIPRLPDPEKLHLPGPGDTPRRRRGEVPLPARPQYGSGVHLDCLSDKQKDGTAAAKFPALKQSLCDRQIPLLLFPGCHFPADPAKNIPRLALLPAGHCHRSGHIMLRAISSAFSCPHR